MYPVTTKFQNKIKETTRTFKILIQVQHSTGVLELTDKDIVGGSVSFTESTQAGDDFIIGGTVASTLEFELFRKPEHDLIEFEGATVIPQIGLLISPAVDTENYFINAPQPSEFEEGQALEQWEYVPLGRFNIDEIIKSRSTIKLKALDNMIELDKPYSLSNLSYPANLYQMYQNICTVADVQPATTSFTNQNHIVNTRPEGDYSLRDILGFVAELSGCFARCDRNGALELAWYTPTDLILTGANRFDFKPREDLIQIKGVKFETEDTVYLAGTDDYVVDLTDNPLLQDDYGTVLSNIYNKVKEVVFTPYESRWQGNPAIQTGDIITQIDRDGVAHTTLVTHSTYKYRGASTLAARGLPLKAKGYKGSTNKKISNIVRKEIKPIGDKLTSLEQAQLNVTELIANMLGGYAFYESDGFYIADNPILENAQKVWKWGIGGFGYSEKGVEGPYTTGITADGTIVAMLVAANIVTADMVKTGILSSEDDSTWINLNDGTFNFKNLLKYTDGVLEMPAQELPDTVVRSDVDYNGTIIGTSEGIRVEFAEGGRAVIGEGGIKAQHIDGSKTSIDGRGITRVFSVPIFEQQPSGTNIIDTFESGISNSRVDITNSESTWGWNDVWDGGGMDLSTQIFTTTEDKYAGSYSLKVVIPPKKTPMSIIGGSGYRTNITCKFLNYKPTKDTTFSMRYKALIPTGVTSRLYIKDLDYPEIPTQVINLTSASWNSVSALLTKHHTYEFRVTLSYDGDSRSDIISYLYLDNMQYELDVNEAVIVGYTESVQPYYDFTYIRKGTFAAPGTQQIVLPDYFKGMNFDVFIMPTGDWRWNNTNGVNGEPRIIVESVNNTIPSFTVKYSAYPSYAIDFIYTVVLND